MLWLFVIMFSVIVAEAVFIWFFVSRATAIIEVYEAKIRFLESGLEQEDVVTNPQTVESVRKVWAWGDAV